ncbi:MAG: bifunctional alpha,alpha-trehalose-phosphate synthase (UDP-forming)/trehalose-phosphatase [Candidatus Aminicenantes bacterium]|nr:bifunctional alpha,alpha-trehalose-phosphate synthase (UDP-forming)/trehalose-phosphatase [Candidatus Aminicenantes bacterium]
MKYEKMQKERIVVVSNRLPVSIRRKHKILKIQSSPGGVATAFQSFQKEGKVAFVGWPGFIPENQEEKRTIEEILIRDHNSYPVFLSSKEIDKYYFGFSNRAIWPLFHYFTSMSEFDLSEWKTYQEVNEKFFQKLSEVIQPHDIIWIHDYHLMLLPGLVRQHDPESTVGFFLHIPFPSSEIFRVLPWRKEVLKGLLGADLIGFHTYEYARHFMSSVLRLLGYEHEFGSVTIDQRTVRVGNFPMGIDVNRVEKLLAKKSVMMNTAELSVNIQTSRYKIFLSVDRLDYTKGIPERLKAFELFLEQNPEQHGHVVMIMICVPSRTMVKDYLLLRHEVERLVGRINGRFGLHGWIPVHYMYRSFPFEKLLPYYVLADVAVVTPIRDGMNLVAKEYVAAKKDETGVLILSEAAGAATELGEAILVNVNHTEELAKAFEIALEGDEAEQKKRMKSMRKRIHDYPLHYWTSNFIESLKSVKRLQDEKKRKKLDMAGEDKIFSAFKSAKNRLLLLDYDGTLVPFAQRPELAAPDDSLIALLKGLAGNTGNTLVIISGRDKETLQEWLNDVPCSLIAEHGAWIRKYPRKKWKMERPLSNEWKKELYPIFKQYEVTVPGSFLEEKDYGLAWHYRKANPELGQIRSRELFDYLNEFLANTDLQVMHGNKIIEVRFMAVNKGRALESFLMQREWPFILAVGDDWTDEDMFKVLPPSSFALKIGHGESLAPYYLDSVKSFRDFLEKLSS